MELRHLRYFVAVAEELHFGRAAERLFIAQPPLSQQIQQLEREIGAPLFARTSRRVTLTAAGEALLTEAREILARVERAGESARRAARGETGWLGIGFSASATYEVLPNALRVFRERYPDVELQLYEMTAAEQAHALREKQIHVGFARPFVEEADLIVEPVAREPFLVALPERHRLAGQEQVAMMELADEPFLLFPQQPKPSYGDAIRALCERAGFAPRVAQEVRAMQTAISLVAAGIGVTLVPESVQDMHRRGVVYRTLAEPSAETVLMMVYRRDDASPTLRAFLDVVREI